MLLVDLSLLGPLPIAVPKYLPAAGRPLPSGLLSFSAKAHGGCEPLDPWNRDTRAGLAAAGPAHRAHLRQCHCSLGRHGRGSDHLPPSLPCTARPRPGIWQVQIPTMSQAPSALSNTSVMLSASCPSCVCHPKRKKKSNVVQSRKIEEILAGTPGKKFDT